MYNKWVKVFKNGTSKICGRQLLKIWIDIVCLDKPYQFKFLKGFYPQILLGPFLNTLTQMLWYFILEQNIFLINKNVKTKIFDFSCIIRRSFFCLIFQSLFFYASCSVKYIYYFKGKKSFWKKLLRYSFTVKSLHFAGKNFPGSTKLEVFTGKWRFLAGKNLLRLIEMKDIFPFF